MIKILTREWERRPERAMPPSTQGGGFRDGSFQGESCFCEGKKVEKAPVGSSRGTEEVADDGEAAQKYW